MIARVVHLIEDDDGVRESLAFSLETAGFIVRAYDLAARFLTESAGVESGCIIVDIRMPGMDGLSLQLELRQRLITLPVIVITGHGDERLAAEALENGAAEFIRKPFDDDLLIGIIDRLLAGQSLR